MSSQPSSVRERFICFLKKYVRRLRALGICTSQMLQDLSHAIWRFGGSTYFLLGSCSQDVCVGAVRHASHPQMR
jgi:hypothetical protein